MNNFIKYNKQIVIIIVFEFLLFLFVVDKLPSLILRLDSYLAQINIIEINLLRTWQRQNGFNTTLAYGGKGRDVELLQRVLSQDVEIYPEKKITGYYGDLTKKAVLKFQAKYNLPQTGVVDVLTRNKLNEIFISVLCPQPTVDYPDFLLKKIDKQNPLPEDYIPPLLENISDKVKTIGVICLRQDVTPYLVKMFNDAQKDGVYFMVTSGYRKPEIQKYLYDFWLRISGKDVLDEIAEPGKSEHQLGTTVDLTDASIEYRGVDTKFAESDGGKWLIKNAHKYGFIMSYPKNKEHITGYEYEPWHWRYVGVELATLLYNKGITFNELDSGALVELYR